MKRGDVVVADIAFSDRQGSKVRSCVVVSADVNNAAIHDVILVAVSRSTRSGAVTHVAVDPGTSDGKIAGLLHRSFIQCENIFTLDQRFILHRLGALTPLLSQQVNEALKRALDLR
jgi:mRNA-degrading endonuclease toxin of MazEF toxin-antitoxin module